MSKIKYRKCPECSGKMVLRKSQKNNKFWGCTMWKENGCSGSAPYFGDGARAGLDLDIREIKNGYVITTSAKYVENIEDEDAVEQFVGNKEELQQVLKDLLQSEAGGLCQRIESSTEFVEEVDQERHNDRVKAVKRGTSNVDELLKRMADAKNRAESAEFNS